MSRQENGSGWINKGSVSYHLKSDSHAKSLDAREIIESAEKAGVQAMLEESAMEEHIDFIILSSTTLPVAATRPAPQQSGEEREMWDRYALGNEVFNTGPDDILAASQERKHLELEATDLDLWHIADIPPEDDPNDGVLLDELE